MKEINSIKPVGEKRAEQLYNSVSVCIYCKTPFKECDTIILGKGIVIGETNVVEYKKRFWHHGCVFDYEKEKSEHIKELI